MTKMYPSDSEKGIDDIGSVRSSRAQRTKRKLPIVSVIM